MTEWTHLDEHATPRMVDVSAKALTERLAIAVGQVYLGPALAWQLKEQGSTKKGPVLQTAIIAGIQAAKKTAELIPLCHPLPLTGVSLEIRVNAERALIQAQAQTTGPTGVEMEALTAVSGAALTLYDMCKGLSHELIIESLFLLEKRGGRSGIFRHAQAEIWAKAWEMA